MTTSKNVPLSKKAQEKVTGLQDSMTKDLNDIKSQSKYEMPTSTPYSMSQQSGNSYLPMPKDPPPPPSSSNTGEPTSSTETSTPKTEEPTSTNENETDKSKSN